MALPRQLTVKIVVRVVRSSLVALESKGALYLARKAVAQEVATELHNGFAARFKKGMAPHTRWAMVHGCVLAENTRERRKQTTRAGKKSEFKRCSSAETITPQTMLKQATSSAARTSSAIQEYVFVYMGNRAVRRDTPPKGILVLPLEIVELEQ